MNDDHLLQDIRLRAIVSLDLTVAGSLASDLPAWQTTQVDGHVWGEISAALAQCPRS